MPFLQSDQQEETTIYMSELHQAVRDQAHNTASTLIAEGTLFYSTVNCDNIFLHPGVDVNLQDSMDRTALHLAAWKGSPELVKLLIQSKASTSIKARDNFSALHFAVQSGSLECCSLLIANNPKLLKESISKGKKKPLHLAAVKNNFEICQLLLDKGADPTAVTSSRQTALDFAKDDKVFQLIKESIAAKIEESEAVAGKRKICDEKDSSVVLSCEEAELVAPVSASASASADCTKLKPESKVTTSAIRKSKKQKVNKKILKLSCYDNEDGDDCDV